MKLSGAIFDMDGTLIDSMHIWHTLGVDYIRSKGFEPEDGMDDLFFAVGIDEFSAYVKERFLPESSSSALAKEINAAVGSKYEQISELRPCVFEYLSKLSSEGVRMCVATATDRVHVEKVLTRCGIIHFFDAIFTCGEVGVPKTKPDIFEAARKYMGTDTTETAVFEDSLHAALTAKRAGFRLVGVYDRFSRHNEQKLREISDVYITTFKELL